MRIVSAGNVAVLVALVVMATRMNEGDRNIIRFIMIYASVVYLASQLLYTYIIHIYIYTHT